MVTYKLTDNSYNPKVTGFFRNEGIKYHVTYEFRGNGLKISIEVININLKKFNEEKQKIWDDISSRLVID